MSKAKEQKPETNAYRQSRLDGFVEVLKLNAAGRILTSDEKEHEAALKREMEFKLNSLRQESRGRELDIKIETTQKVIHMLKNGLAKPSNV